MLPLCHLVKEKNVIKKNENRFYSKDQQKGKTGTSPNVVTRYLTNDETKMKETPKKNLAMLSTAPTQSSLVAEGEAEALSISRLFPPP